jgi:penicillin amidase
VRREIISVLGSEPVEVEVRTSVHGPIISDVDSSFSPARDGGAGLGREGRAYALAWTAITGTDRTFDAVLGVNRARSWDEFREALRNFAAPSQTFLYADVEGHIGVQVPGAFPIRAAGDGAYPVPGDEGAYDWTGLVDYDDLPMSFDPPGGLIVAANNQPSDPAGVFLGRDFDPGFRAERIHELLDGDASITTDQLRSLQGDDKLTRAAPVVAALAGVSASSADGELVRERLAEWSARLGCDTDSLGCAAYETFEYWLLRLVFDDELGAGREPTDGAWRYVGTEASHDLIGRLVGQPDSPWWDDVRTAERETRNELLGAALDRAGEDLRDGLGDPVNWYWGRLHSVTFQEQTLGTSGIGPLEWIFNRGPFPASGSCTTVDKICGSIGADWPIADETSDLQTRFSSSSSPSYRLVMDMTDFDGVTILQATGQSGVPFDSHYGDFIGRWLANQPFPLPWTQAAVDGSTRQTLLLQP